MQISLVKNLARVKFCVLSIKLRIKFYGNVILSTFDNHIINYIISKWDVLLVIHNFSELRSLANNAKLDPR